MYALGARKFRLEPDKLLFGHAEYLQMQISDGDRTSEKQPSGTMDILFMDPEYVFIWAPVK